MHLLWLLIAFQWFHLLFLCVLCHQFIEVMGWQNNLHGGALTDWRATCVLHTPFGSYLCLLDVQTWSLDLFSRLHHNDFRLKYLYMFVFDAMHEDWQIMCCEWFICIMRLWYEKECLTINYERNAKQFRFQCPIFHSKDPNITVLAVNVGNTLSVSNEIVLAFSCSGQ